MSLVYYEQLAGDDTWAQPWLSNRQCLQWWAPSRGPTPWGPWTHTTLVAQRQHAACTQLTSPCSLTPHAPQVAVIVNDMAELNIDGALVANSKLIQREEKLVGCV